MNIIQQRHSLIKQNLQRLRFLKAAFLKTTDCDKRTKLKYWIISVIENLKNLGSRRQIPRILGTATIGLLFAGQSIAQNFSEAIPIDTLGTFGFVSSDLVDIDEDGDLDLIAINPDFYSDFGTSYYPNEGTPDSLALSNMDIELGNFLSNGDINVVNELVDIDSDGDLDLLSLAYVYYDYCLALIYAENLGGLDFQQVEQITIDSSSFKLAGTLECEIVDFDDDGDLDLLTLGNNLEAYYSGDIRLGLGFVENIGSPTEAVWDTLAIVENFPRIENEEEAAAFLEAADYDGDGDLDIVLSKYTYDDGYAFQVLYIENLGGSYGDPVEIRLNDEQEGIAIPIKGDLDNDGDLDLMFQLYSLEDEIYNLYWVENQLLSSTTDIALKNFSLTSNKVSSLLDLNYDLVESRNLQLDILSSDGKLINSETINNVSGIGLHQMDVSTLSTGIHFLNVSNGEGQQTLKFFKN